MKKLFLMFAVAGLIASCTGNGNTSGSTSASGEAKDGASGFWRGRRVPLSKSTRNDGGEAEGWGSRICLQY